MKGEKDKVEDLRNQEEQQDRLPGLFLRVTSDSATVSHPSRGQGFWKWAPSPQDSRGTGAEIQLESFPFFISETSKSLADLGDFTTERPQGSC